ncbi:MAG: hypothetical protein ABFD50_02660 [Smithella sp.]
MKKPAILIIVIFLLAVIPALAAEKQVNLKGLYIGMPVEEAKVIFKNNLGTEWKITATGNTSTVLSDYRLGNDRIFGANRTGGNSVMGSLIGDYGFAIHRYDYYEGFISADKNTKKITRITISGEITDDFFNTRQIGANEFVSQFTKNFDLPDFNWITSGWIYTSPLGYVITIRTNKFIDINMINPVPGQEKSGPDKSK